MTELPRRRLMDRLGASPSVLSASTLVKGDIETAGAMLVNGKVRGNGLIGGELALAEGAHWEGDVQAANAVVAGTLVGKLVVEGKLEIGKSAVLRGSVTARRIAIAMGATIDGDVQVTGSEAPVQFEEKRAAVPAA